MRACCELITWEIDLENQTKNIRLLLFYFHLGVFIIIESKKMPISYIY